MTCEAALAIMLVVGTISGWWLRSWMGAPWRWHRGALHRVEPPAAPSEHGLGLRPGGVVASPLRMALTPSLEPTWSVSPGRTWLTGMVTLFNGPELGDNPRRVHAAINRWLEWDWRNK